MVATTNRVVPQRPIEVPANAVLVDWLSYSQLMPAASLVISHGGHGTVARALGAGTPVLICPIIGDMSETAMRVAWAGPASRCPGASAGRRRCAGRPGACCSDPSFAGAGRRARRLGTRERRRRARRRAGRAAGARQPTRQPDESSGGGTRTHNPSINSRVLFH